MKYCTNCGTQNPDGAQFCTNCGQEFRNTQMNNTYQGYGYGYAEPGKSPSNGFAIAGFVLSFFFPILRWIFGGIGLSKSRNLNGKGRGLAIAALVIATVNFLLGVTLSFALQPEPEPTSSAIRLLF